MAPAVPAMSTVLPSALVAMVYVVPLTVIAGPLTLSVAPSRTNRVRESAVRVLPLIVITTGAEVAVAWLGASWTVEVPPITKNDALGARDNVVPDSTMVLPGKSVWEPMVRGPDVRGKVSIFLPIVTMTGPKSEAFGAGSNIVDVPLTMS